MTKSRQDLCPVCGMIVVNEDYVLERYKMYYHFCSEQCRDNFQEHPNLYIGSTTKAHKEIMKSKRIYLSKALTAESVSSIKTRLQQLMGINEIQFEGRTLQIQYDLRQSTFAQIESALSELGDVLDNRWWQRFRRALTRYTESNELESLALPPSACCNRPPPRL